MAQLNVIHEIGDFGYPEPLNSKDNQVVSEQQTLDDGEAARIEARAKMYESMCK